MNRKALPYKDTWAAPGSALYAALEAHDTAQAYFLYYEAEVEYQRYNGTDEHFYDVADTFSSLVKERAEQAAVDAAQLIAGKKK